MVFVTFLYPFTLTNDTKLLFCCVGACFGYKGVRWSVSCVLYWAISILGSYKSRLERHAGRYIGFMRFGMCLGGIS